MLNEEEQLAKRQYMHTTTSTTTPATCTRFTTITATSIATTCKAKSIRINILRTL